MKNYAKIGDINLPNNPEMISRMYEVWTSIATKILRRSIFLQLYYYTTYSSFQAINFSNLYIIVLVKSDLTIS